MAAYKGGTDPEGWAKVREIYKSMDDASSRRRRSFALGLAALMAALALLVSVLP